MKGELILLVALALIVSGCVGQSAAPAATGETTDTLQEDLGEVTSLSDIPAGKGKLVFAVTDTFLDMGDVTSVVLTIGKVEAHREGGDWSTVSSQPRSYDLLKLKGVDRFLAEANVDPATYDQFRLTISNVNVVSGETGAASMPSTLFTLIGKAVVIEGTDSYVRVDFAPEQSLHETASGGLVFAPVVTYQTWREASVSLSNGYLTREGGHKLSDKSLGMDIKGDTGSGLQISGDAELSVDSAGRITILSQAATAENIAVHISNYQFGPNSVRIGVGGTVKWINDDDVVHDVNADDGSFSSPDLLKGGSFEHTFDKEGIYAYHCDHHELMKGTVYVE